MIDREKVIKGLECCSNDKPFYHAHCDDCPYNGRNPDNLGGCTKLYCDALELLKQEPVAVQQREMMHMLFWCCGSCGAPITEGDKFCRMCGKEVKWNDQKKIEKNDHVLRDTAE